jgi:transcription antitermination factor NusG
MGLKIAENPSETAENYPDLSVIRSPWLVACTYARCEKKLAEKIYCRYPELPYFLPLIAKRTLSRNISISCLFPGFIFVAASPESIGERVILEQKVKDVLIGTGFVHSFLTTPDQDNLRRELALLAQSSPAARTLREDFPPGRRVRVAEGPLMGLEGVVESGEKQTIIIRLTVLGQIVSTTLPQGVLEPL